MTSRYLFGKNLQKSNSKQKSMRTDAQTEEREQRAHSFICYPLGLTEMLRAYSSERLMSLVNDFGKTGHTHTHTKEW